MDRVFFGINFQRLCSNLSLGSLKNEPERVLGGLLHKMYKITTNQGSYAIKVLNPSIVKRPFVLQLYETSEEVARVVLSNNINALPALKFNNRSLIELNKQHMLVYPWFNGKSLEQGIIDIDKCKIMGSTLAKIHSINFSQITNIHKSKSEYQPTDWNMLISNALAQDIEWGRLLVENNNLYVIEETALKAKHKLHNTLVISHGDLDQKNVLWSDNKPMLIDWEGAGYINPTLELVGLALDWSTSKKGIVNNKAFESVISSYTTIKNLTDSIETALLAVFKGKLDWLAYNMRRSLRIECSSDEEQQLGTSQVIKTLRSIKNHSEQIKRLNSDS